MRISDWSSDVCSSDLAGCIPEGKAFPKLISSFWNCVQQQLRCGDPGSARDNKPRRTEPAQPKLRSTQSRRFPPSTPNPQRSQGRPAAAPYWRETQGDGTRRRRLRQNKKHFLPCATLRGLPARPEKRRFGTKCRSKCEYREAA